MQGLQYSIFDEMKAWGGRARNTNGDENRWRLSILQWPGEQMSPLKNHRSLFEGGRQSTWNRGWRPMWISRKARLAKAGNTAISGGRYLGYRLTHLEEREQTIFIGIFVIPFYLLVYRQWFSKRGEVTAESSHPGAASSHTGISVKNQVRRQNHFSV